MKQKNESKEKKKATKKQAYYILSSFVFLKGMIKQQSYQTTRGICDDVGYIGGSDAENKLKNFDKKTDKEDCPPIFQKSSVLKSGP
ncbi:hypothetical protein LG21E20_17640 [Lactococcus formosensis]|nr:hypothetical protein [Lactococcus formosensis]BDW50102.1 hypothetical protein LG21E20_17640 [Lactococcus formosensis]BDX25691.1 hypothetical protein LFMS200408A_17680 [Lactococcus formosensis]